MKKFKVIAEEVPVVKVCEYCGGTGYKGHKFFEEFKNEEVDFTYICPSCNGAKSIVKEDEKEINYSKEEVEFLNRQEIYKDGYILDFNVERVEEIDFYSPNLENKMCIGGEYFKLENEDKRNVEYFYFDTEVEADLFMAHPKY